MVSLSDNKIKEDIMSHSDKIFEPSVIAAALQYLLEVRRQQLAEELNEPSHRGDKEWTNRLRDEVDQSNRLLQILRDQYEEAHVQ